MSNEGCQKWERKSCYRITVASYLLRYVRWNSLASKAIEEIIADFKYFIWDFFFNLWWESEVFLTLKVLIWSNLYHIDWDWNSNHFCNLVSIFTFEKPYFLCLFLCIHFPTASFKIHRRPSVKWYPSAYHKSEISYNL